MKIAFVLAFALGASASLSGQEAAPLTLARTIDAVLARYPSIDAAQAAIDAARARTEQSGADRLPQISAEGNYLHMSLRPHVNFGPTVFYPTIHDSYTTGIAARQLLTDFGRTDALVDLARAGEISAQDALEQARSQLGYQAIQDFYGVLLLRQSVAVADEEITALREALRVSNQKFANGSATKFDVLTTQVRLATAQNRRTDTVAALQKEEAALRALLGYPAATEVALNGDFSAAPPSPPDLSAVLSEALRNRPEMKLARDGADQAQHRLDAAGRANRPVIAAQAEGGVEDAQLPALYDNKGYVNAGVSVSVPLFTGRRISGERAEARAGVRAADARVRELNQTITSDIEGALADLGAAAARLGTADTLVEQSREALSLAQSRYANGVITNFELLDAQSSARSAELARIQARYDCTLSAKALDRAAGRAPAP